MVNTSVVYFQGKKRDYFQQRQWVSSGWDPGSGAMHLFFCQPAGWKTWQNLKFVVILQGEPGTFIARQLTFTQEAPAAIFCPSLEACFICFNQRVLAISIHVSFPLSPWIMAIYCFPRIPVTPLTDILR